MTFNTTMSSLHTPQGKQGLRCFLVLSIQTSREIHMGTPALVNCKMSFPAMYSDMIYQ